MAGAVSGLLAALSLPPFSLWFLAPVALLPGAVGVLSARNPVVAVRAGLLFGLVYWGVVLHWLPGTLLSLGPSFVLPGAMLLLILIGTGGVQFLALHALSVDRGWSPILALPAVWGGTDFVFANAGPLAFPWAPLGLSLAAVPRLASMAEVGGVIGLTVWMTAVSGILVVAVRSRRRDRGRAWIRPALLAAVVLAGPASWGIQRAGNLRLHMLPPVALVQLDLSIQELRDPRLRDAAAEERLDRLLAGQGWREGGMPALLAMPEAPFAATWEAGVGEWTRAWVDELGVPILMGAHRDGERRQNAAFLETPSGGTRFIHSKRRLVPGGEWPALAPGRNVEVGELPGLTFGVLICFESAFGAEAAQLRREGAELLVNPTIDAWAGTGWRGTGSAAHAQHRAHLALRAIETRTGAVRAALGGELLLVDPVGRVQVVSPVGGEGIWTVHPLGSEVTSIRTRLGDMGGLLALLLLASLFLRRRRVADAA